jgi:hypothetical protein
VATPPSLSDTPETSLPAGEFAAEAAEALVAHILREGFEQGCALPIEARRFLVSTDEHAQKLGESWAKLDRAARGRCDELELRVDPGLAQGNVGSFEEGFVILTQQCDLAREPSQEPTIEVVRVTRRRSKEAGMLRSLKSWRQIVVTDVDDQAIVADSRQRFLLDKRSLLAFPAMQLMPDDPDARRRFAWWAGARYFRRPVPTRLYQAIEKPLRDALGDQAVMAIAEKFLMFIIDAVDKDAPRLLGIFDGEERRAEMEAAMEELVTLVPFEGMSEDDYDVSPVDQTSIALYLGATTYLLDLEAFSGSASPKPPALATDDPANET